MNGREGERLEIGVLGATGVVGQRIVSLVAGHPWFRLTWLGASERSAGRRYGDLPWRLDAPRPDDVADLVVEPAERAPGHAPRLLLSALDAGVAGELERACAAAGHLVVSNARSHRMDPLVPLVVPEINADHLDLLAAQRRAYGWRGGIVTNPNCSTVVLALALAALRPYAPRAVVVTTLQAASGAGYPGVASLDLLANVIPFIDGEEEKIQRETNKILGRRVRDGVEPHPVRVSAHTTRVPVVDGHTEAIGVELGEPAAAGELRAAFERFDGPPQRLGLPTAPRRPIVYRDEPDRPQPRRDADCARGMAIVVGRLRPCPVLGWKFVALGHTTLRGAAGAALLTAELLAAGGHLD